MKREMDNENETVTMSREMEVSIAASSMFPGFRFSPTDEELISYYLNKKIRGSEKCVEVIPELDICAHEPWDLPVKSVIQSDKEWFFFSARGRKYPNGSQSRRATKSGYWKATGKERNVKSGSSIIGTKRTLVFHIGRAPKGERTEWIMHEYCRSRNSQDGKKQLHQPHLQEYLEDSLVVCRLRKNSEFHLNDSRRGSINRRHLADGDNGTFSFPEDGIQHDRVPDGVKKVDGYSKESASSYNSQSADQIDSGSESDKKLSNQSPRHGSSTEQKSQDCGVEDDCFADIMKDDIVKLDDSSLSTGLRILPPILSSQSDAKIKSEQAEAVRAVVLPFQGTASRRIKLRVTRAKIYHMKPSLEAFSNNQSGSFPNHRSINWLSSMSFDWRYVSVILIALTLLVVGVVAGIRTLVTQHVP